jgi:hypothetical protein
MRAAFRESGISVPLRHNMIVHFLSVVAGVGLVGVTVGSGYGRIGPDEAVVGERVDIARFGRSVSGGDFVGVEWDNPRNVCEVRIEGVDASSEGSLRLEWWGSVWPANGSGGWMRLDDPWNGRWVRAKAEATKGAAGELVFRFPPLAKDEWDKALKPEQYPGKQDPEYRRTLKVRVVGENGAISKNAELRVFGNSRWKEASFDIETRQGQDEEAYGRIEVINGVLVSAESLGEPRSVKVSGNTWTGPTVAGGSTGVRIRLRYAENEDLNSNDLTRVTVRLGDSQRATGFSFVAQDVLKEGVIRLPSFNAIVRASSAPVTAANDGGAAGYWDKPVRRRLRERPEMTREAAMAGIPRLEPARWVPVGVPSARQEFFIGPNGDWKISALSLNTDNGRDAKRWMFKKDFGRERQYDELLAVLDTRAEPKFDGGDRQGLRRWLEDGWLPLIHVEWQSGPIRYHHVLTATILRGDYGDDVGRKGDETVVLLSRLEISNRGEKPHTAVLNLRYSNPAAVRPQEDGIIALEGNGGDGLWGVRGMICTDRPTGGGIAGWTLLAGTDAESSEILRWREALGEGEKRLIYFKMPFVELLDAEELRRLKEISYEQEVPRVLDYWRRRAARGMQIETPDDEINNLYRANLWHNVITTDRDPETGLYNQGVATVGYRVFANETVMIARSMDMRGEHKEAERYLEPMLHFQGSEALKGRFSTRQGAFHGAGQYTHGEYAMNHGFVLWGVAEHYLMTRDREYLDRVAPKLVKGCDFSISERASTMGEENSAIYGLSPASSLEDVVEYQYWFATNSYFYLGMKRVAEALADIRHPEAERIAREAERYRRDIEAAAREATTRAAVVRLRDGNFVPYVPSRVFQWRHLTEGWIREALYCSLHLGTAGVVSYDDPLMTWMLEDLEDNIFFSWQSGYNVSDYEQRWFERGGVTLQPCLLDMPIAYMARDEIPAALRAFWNTYALSIYPDMQCFAEWARRFGVGGGPVYKTSDESRFVMWLRQLLVWEDGKRLWFGRAMPREWLRNGNTVRVEGAATQFGTAGMVVRSRLGEGKITATVTMPERRRPSEVWLRLRHPEGARPSRVYVNGRPARSGQIVGEDVQLVGGTVETSGEVEVTAEYE